MANYFVSNKPGEVGNDGNSGLSQLLPFLTLGKLSATALLNAADSAQLNRGSSFAESLSIRGNGTAGNLITFTSYGTGVRPVITACDIPPLVFDSAVAGGDRYKRAALGWTPHQSFREDGVVPNGVTRNLFKQVSLVACVNLHDWFYTGADFYVVVATGEVPNSVGPVTIHVGRRNSNVVEFTPGQDFIRLDNLICRFTDDDTGTFSGINCNQNSTSNTGWVLNSLLVEWAPIGIKLDGQGTNSFAEVRVCTLTNSEVRFCHSHGVNLIFLSAGSLVDNLNCWGNGRAGIGFAARNSVISRSFFNQNANVLAKWTAPLAVQGFDHGAYIVGQVPNFDRAFGNVIVDCIASLNGKAGFATDALASTMTFLRDISFGNLLFGFMLEGGTTNSSSGTKVYQCTAWNNLKSALHCVNCHGPFDARNNQFYFNGRDGSQDLYIEWNIGSWVLHSGTAGVDAVWRHDHLDYDIVAVGDAAHVILTPVGSIAAVQAAANTWFKSGAAGTEGSLYVRKTGSGGTTGDTYWCDPNLALVTLNWNNYTPVAERPVGHAIFRYTYSAASNVSGTTIASLQGSVLAKEANGIQFNPSYVNAAGGDFHLGIGSSSIDVGTVIAGINDGTGGSTRFRGTAPDLGAFESGAGSARKRRRALAAWLH